MSQPFGGPPDVPPGQVPGWQPYPYQQQPPAWQPAPPPGYPYPPPYPLPPQPRRGNRLVLYLVLGITAALLVCGGLGVAAFLFARDRNTGTPSTAAQSTEHPGDLRGYLIDAPAGTHPWKSPPGTDGHLSLEQDAALSTDAAAMRDQLHRYHFQEGAVRTWHAADDTLVEARLLRFGSDRDAASFYQADARATSRAYDAANVTTVDGVTDGIVIGDPAKNSNGYVHIIALARRGDVVIVVLVSQVDTLKPSVGEQLVKAQYGRL